MVTSQGSLETAVEAIRAGAYDFISKPVSLATLEVAIERAVAYQTLRREVQQLRLEVAAAAAGRHDRRRQPGDPRGDLDGPTRRGQHGDRADHRRERDRQGAGRPRDPRPLGRAATSRSSRSTAGRCRRRCSRASCSGTCAARSPTRARPGRACSCRPATARCSSTRSARCRSRCRSSCCASSRSARVRPVGGDAEIPFGARLITATNRDLETDDRGQAVPRGPVLSHQRRRRSTCRRCARGPATCSRSPAYFISADRGADRQAGRRRSPTTSARKLVAYDWPGNVRELQNCIERAMALGSLNQITLDELPEKIRDHQAPPTMTAIGPPRRADHARRDRAPLRPAGARGDQQQPVRAARILGIDRRSLYRRMHGPDAVEPVEVEPGA